VGWSYSELHALGTGGPELSGNDNLATLGARLHDETEDTIASTADGKTVEELVAEGLALSDGGQTTVLDLGGVQGDGVLGELEALLDERGELTDAATLLSEDLLGVCGADDDVGDGGRHADLDARVALLSELALEELVQLGVENTVCGLLATHSRWYATSPATRIPSIVRSDRSRILWAVVAGSVWEVCVPATNFLLLEIADWVVAILDCRTVG
jgi:hypothetical protein